MKTITIATIAVCLASNAFADSPDPTKTPGVIMPSCTKEDAITSGYTQTVRNVPRSLATAVYERYGIEPHHGPLDVDDGLGGKCSPAQGCEVDHLISLVLCGDNKIENLWPQSYSGACNAHDKDRLEVRLHHMVQGEAILLEDAQRAISTDWVAAFTKYVDPAGCGAER